MRPLTKIYFIALLSSFFTVRAQDTLQEMSLRSHFYLSLQGGSTFFGNFKFDGDALPIGSLYASYIPKNSKIVISAGPSFMPLNGLAYFGGGINAKIFLGKKIIKRNMVFEAGDRLAYSQQTFDYGSAIETDKYSVNNLYLGLGYLIFFGKEEKFFVSLTGDICVNAYKANYANNLNSGPHPGLSSYSNTTIAPLILLQAGLKIR
jgi:hypothetical protein